MSEDTKAEQAAWHDLLQSPGWERLAAHVRTEWEGPAFVAQVEQLADNPQNEAALSKLRQLLAAKRAVLRLLALPAEQLGKAKRLEAEEAPVTGRRGRL